MAGFNPYAMDPQELLARTLMAEAGGEGPLGQQAVAAVIANRVKSPQYPNDWRETILQPRQFSAWNALTGAGAEHGANTAMYGDIPPDIQQIAERVLAGDYEDPTGGALNYANPAASDPSNQGWIKNMSNQVQIGNHLFGTAGGGGGGGSVSGGGGSMAFAGGAGADTMAPPPDTSFGGRVRSGFNKILGPNTDNPTISSKQFANRAERARDRVDSARDIYQTNAPTSWLNVLGDAVGELGASSLDRAAGREQQRGQEMLAGYMGQELTPELVAQVMALDPEQGRLLQQQLAAQKAAEQERAYRTSEREATQQFQVEQAEAALEREKELANYKVGLPTDATEQVDEYVERVYGLKEGEEGWNEAWKESWEKLNPAKTTDSRTTIEKDAEAAGYVPGTKGYQDFVKAQYDVENSPEVKAAEVAAKALEKGDEEYAKATGKAIAEASRSLMSAGASAHRRKASWELARKKIEDFNSGALAPTQLAVGQFLSSLGLEDTALDGIFEELGISPGQAASMEQVEKIVNEVIIGKIGTSGDEGGFPANNFSNADLQFLMTSVPGLTNSQGGIRAKLTALEWSDKVTAAKADAWLEYRKELNRSPTEMDWDIFNQEWANGPASKEFEKDLMRSIAADETVSNPKMVVTDADYAGILDGAYYKFTQPDGTVVRARKNKKQEGEQ